jgi:hypothetical protein
MDRGIGTSTGWRYSPKTQNPKGPDNHKKKSIEVISYARQKFVNFGVWCVFTLHYLATKRQIEKI